MTAYSRTRSGNRRVLVSVLITATIFATHTPAFAGPVEPRACAYFAEKRQKWRTQLGPLITPCRATSDGVGVREDYTHGGLISGGESTAGKPTVYALFHDVWLKYVQTGAEKFHGYPTSDQILTGHTPMYGYVKLERGGMIVDGPDTPPVALKEEAASRWEQEDGPDGPLGYPTSDSEPTLNVKGSGSGAGTGWGSVTDFQHGRIFWYSTLGALVDLGPPGFQEPSSDRTDGDTNRELNVTATVDTFDDNPSAPRNGRDSKPWSAAFRVPGAPSSRTSDPSGARGAVWGEVTLRAYVIEQRAMIVEVELKLYEGSEQSTAATREGFVIIPPSPSRPCPCHVRIAEIKAEYDGDYVLAKDVVLTNLPLK